MPATLRYLSLTCFKTCSWQVATFQSCLTAKKWLVLPSGRSGPLTARDTKPPFRPKPQAKDQAKMIPDTQRKMRNCITPYQRAFQNHKVCHICFGCHCFDETCLNQDVRWHCCQQGRMQNGLSLQQAGMFAPLWGPLHGQFSRMRSEGFSFHAGGLEVRVTNSVLFCQKRSQTVLSKNVFMDDHKKLMARSWCSIVYNPWPQPIDDEAAEKGYWERLLKIAALLLCSQLF